MLHAMYFDFKVINNNQNLLILIWSSKLLWDLKSNSGSWELQMVTALFRLTVPKNWEYRVSTYSFPLSVE